MKSMLIRYLLIVLLLAVIVASLLLYIGGDRFINMAIVDSQAIRPEGGYKISVQALILAAIAAIIAIISIWTLIRFIVDIPSRLRTGASKRKNGKALEAMEDAMIAANAGDATAARRKSARARELIGRPALGRIVSAQSAEVVGDLKEAEQHYTDMLEDTKTHHIGQRGLANIAFKQGDHAAAISYAQSAYDDSKGAQWAFDILFGSYVNSHDWDEAISVLEQGEKRKHIDKDIAARRKAVLGAASAAKLASAHKRDEATQLAENVAAGMLSFAPAIALASKLLVTQGQDERAAKLIEKAWSKSPHPALSLAYRDIIDNEPAKTQSKRMKSLIKQNPNHRESVILTVEEALNSGDGTKAWGLLSTLVNAADPQYETSARLCTLAAKSEELCDNHKDAKLWLAKAAIAPSEADWSDLDPEGSAFNYTNDDWTRLVYSFGDKGELIHPRHERFEKTRPIIDVKTLQELASKAPETKLATEGNTKTKPASSTHSQPEVKAPSPDVIIDRS